MQACVLYPGPGFLICCTSFWLKNLIINCIIVSKKPFKNECVCHTFLQICKVYSFVTSLCISFRFTKPCGLVFLIICISFCKKACKNKWVDKEKDERVPVFSGFHYASLRLQKSIRHSVLGSLDLPDSGRLSVRDASSHTSHH